MHFVKRNIKLSCNEKRIICHYFHIYSLHSIAVCILLLSYMKWHSTIYKFVRSLSRVTYFHNNIIINVLIKQFPASFEPPAPHSTCIRCSPVTIYIENSKHSLTRTCTQSLRYAESFHWAHTATSTNEIMILSSIFNRLAFVFSSPLWARLSFFRWSKKSAGEVSGRYTRGWT